MLFNIWKTCTVCSNIAPRLLGRAWEQSGSEADSVISVSGQHSVYPSVCLFIWLSNYPSRQTAPQELNVNNTAQCYPRPGCWSSVSSSVVSVVFHLYFFIFMFKRNLVDCRDGSSQCVRQHVRFVNKKSLKVKSKNGTKSTILHVKDDRNCITLSNHCEKIIACNKIHSSAFIIHLYMYWIVFNTIYY